MMHTIAELGVNWVAPVLTGVLMAIVPVMIANTKPGKH